MTDTEWRAANDRALTAVCAALTEDERAAILNRWAPPGSRMHGAHVDDLLEMAYDADALIMDTEPFWEANEGDLPAIPGVGFALYALVMARQELTVAAVLDLCQRAGLIAAKEAEQ
jgi:hypothetical protein